MTGSVIIALLLAAWLALRLFAKVPARKLLPSAQAPGDTTDTRLGRITTPLALANPGLSGVRLIDDPADALASRLALIAAADRWIDLQYYIWRKDSSGYQLLAELRRAADRGVRVRLLLDDNGIAGLDADLAAINGHDNIELRLFNPYRIRKPRAINYLVDFPRLNRRMHNKSFTVDNQATIIGGRNIGDEYFGRSRISVVADLDVIAIGAIVAEVSADFDRYWNCMSAYPAELILPPATAVAVAPPKADSGGSIEDRLGFATCEWVHVAMVSDDPAKGLGLARESRLLWPRLLAAIGQPRATLGLVSAYFVPTRSGIAAFAKIASRDVRIDILTNSLKANNVAVVHAGYAPSRIPLLRAGIRLWELKGAHPERKAKLKLRSGIVRGSVFKSSGTALHAKTFAVDGERLFVGSFNFDPRSLKTNTEIGFIIASPTMARGLDAMFDGDIAKTAYEVRLNERGRLYWIEQGDDGEIIHPHEPGTGPLQRAIIAVLCQLPVKWLL